MTPLSPATLPALPPHVARFGYNRAADLIDQMEKEGIITPADHAGRRTVLARRSGEDED